MGKGAEEVESTVVVRVVFVDHQTLNHIEKHKRRGQMFVRDSLYSIHNYTEALQQSNKSQEGRHEQEKEKRKKSYRYDSEGHAK